MSVIKPFKGWRPGVDIVQKLASRPYDVLNTEEARKECEGNPYSLSAWSSSERAACSLRRTLRPWNTPTTRPA